MATGLVQAGAEVLVKISWKKTGVWKNTIRKMGGPIDIAGTAVFLASEASDYITGQTIFVDGSWLRM